jgi:IS5 family transposase
VIQQTQQRVFGGNRRVDGKIVSLFEPHSQVIRKGKAHIAFGKLGGGGTEDEK